MFRRRTVRRSRAQVKVWATIPVPDSQPVLTDLGWHTDFAQHYVKVRGLACAGQVGVGVVATVGRSFNSCAACQLCMYTS